MDDCFRVVTFKIDAVYKRIFKKSCQGLNVKKINGGKEWRY